MDILLDSLKTAIEHLAIVDKIFSTENHQNKTRYLEIKKRISELNLNDPDTKFTDFLYVGGKKGGRKGYARHMILSDIIEYIFFGRGYYYVNEDDLKRKKTFIELILNTINLLMIIDSLTVQHLLRKKTLDELSSKIGSSFYKDESMKKLHDALSLYEADIGFDTKNTDLPTKVNQILDEVSGNKSNKNKLDDYYDSLLPKTGGGLWNELIVFFYLLRRTSVFIIPLLLVQRILSKDELLKPPDYLVIDKDKQLYGIEVGGGKEAQSSNFASSTGSRMLTTQNENIPPRCPICGEWILFCRKVIEDCTDIENNPLLRINKEVRCAHECKYYKPDQVINGECPDIQYHGEVSDNTVKNSRQNIKFKTEYHYHYSCIKNVKDSKALQIVKEQYERWKRNQMDINVLKTSYPYIRGIKNLENLEKKEIVCYGKYPNVDIKNCEVCNHRKDCEKYTKLMELGKNARLTNEQENELKRLLE